MAEKVEMTSQEIAIEYKRLMHRKNFADFQKFQNKKWIPKE